MPREPLPLECVLKILNFLSEEYEYDTDTMVCLLRVNRTICAATLPFLYGDCFNANIHLYSKRTNKKDPRCITFHMIRTLLQQVHPQSRISDLLRVTYLSQDDQDDLSSTQEPPTPLFEYGYFIRQIVPYYGFVSHMFEHIRRNSPVMDYATTHQLYERHVNDGIISNHVRHEYKEEALAAALKMDIHRQMMWLLCQDRLESIKVLSIPLTDIERYIDHVDQFTSLSKVIFSSANGVWLQAYMDTHHRSEDREQRCKELEYTRDRLFKAMVQFVQRHTSIHKDVLRSVETPHPTNLAGTNQHSPTDILFELISLLPPLQNPRSIETSNWYELVTRLSDINLDYLESIDLTSEIATEHVEKIAEILSNQPPLLQRCRALKKLAMDTLGPDMFHWALQEKKQKDAGHRHTLPLVPLRSIQLYKNSSLRMVQELGDIAFAFSESLEELAVYDWEENGRLRSISHATAPRFVHGQGWNLPLLRDLAFTVDSFQLHFDMGALQRSRALESLRLHDGIMTYNHRDIRLWSPVNLPHLKRLELTGSPALHFNLDSLHHSPCLEELTLGVEVFERLDRNYFHMPPPEDLEWEDSGNQGSMDPTTDDYGSFGAPGTSQGYHSIGTRPRFTWNWYLPKLCKLYLKAVFAFRFDFQWLQQLQNLQHMHLDTRSDDKVHERHITLKDLLRGQPERPHDENGSGQNLSGQYVNLPKLESIKFDGQWVFEEKVLETLCFVVAPNLRNVDLERDCAGYTLQEWMALSRRMPRMEKMCLNLPLSFMEVREIGLIPKLKLPARDRDKKLLEYSLYSGSFYDVLEP